VEATGHAIGAGAARIPRAREAAYVESRTDSASSRGRPMEGHVGE